MKSLCKLLHAINTPQILGDIRDSAHQCKYGGRVPMSYIGINAHGYEHATQAMPKVHLSDTWLRAWADIPLVDGRHDGPYGRWLMMMPLIYGIVYLDEPRRAFRQTCELTLSPQGL